MKPYTGQHGTEAGYRAHRRRGEPACPPCLEGHAANNRGVGGVTRFDPRGGLPRCPMHTSTAYMDERGPYTTAIGQCVLDQGHPGNHLTPPIRPTDTLVRP